MKIILLIVLIVFAGCSNSANDTIKCQHCSAQPPLVGTRVYMSNDGVIKKISSKQVAVNYPKEIALLWIGVYDNIFYDLLYDTSGIRAPKICIWPNGDMFWNVEDEVFYAKLERDTLDGIELIVSQLLTLKEDANYSDIFKDEDSTLFFASARKGNNYSLLVLTCSWWKNNFFSPTDFSGCIDYCNPHDKIWSDVIVALDHIALSKYDVYVLKNVKQNQFWRDIKLNHLLPYLSCLHQK